MLIRSLCFLGPFTLQFACADLTVPISSEAPAQPKPKPAATPTPKPPPPARPSAPQESVRASHVLIAFKGSARSTQTRSKEEAKKKATALVARARGGADFADLAKKHSDGPSAPKGGDLGKFQRGAMVKPFADAAFALNVGDVSDVVETPFGFHVIKRTE